MAQINELLILRHGKSDWGIHTDDFQRPLKKRGRRNAEQVGAWLLQQGLAPTYVLTSPATRALTTTGYCCRSMGIAAEQIKEERRIYDASVTDLLDVLKESPAESDRIMLVGHNPSLEGLLLWLADETISRPADGKLLPTATLARLTLSCGWSELDQGCAHLESIVRPADIGERT
jgi:phosphohistidine phosphatase